MLLSRELHTSTTSQLPQVLLPLLAGGRYFFCSIGPLRTVRSMYSFLLIASAGLLAPLGTSDPCTIFLFSPSFLSSQRNYTGVLHLPPVVSLLYSKLFPISERSQTVTSCLCLGGFPLHTSQHLIHSLCKDQNSQAKKFEVLCSNRNNIFQGFFLASLFTVGHNFAQLVSLEHTRKVKAVE